MHFLRPPLQVALWAAILTLAGARLGSPAHAEPTPPQAEAITAFVAVNVAPMDSERILLRQTVLVENGRITAVGPSIAIPKSAKIIDGHGSAYLSPGLADMHTHSDTSADMKLYLANGVTTVLNMGEASNGFMTQVRPALNRGDRPGPHVYAAFEVDGAPDYGHFVVAAPDEARWIVRLAKTNGYEFIKVYNNLSPEVFQALIEEGRVQGIPIVGHGVTRVGLKRQLDAGQVLVAHAEEFLYTTFIHTDGDENAAPDLGQIPAAIAFIKRDKAFVTADLNTYGTIARQWGKPEAVEGLMSKPELRYLNPGRRVSWRGGDYTGRKGDLGARLEFLKRFIKAMSDAGVPLVAGTDAPTIPGLAPGYSLHDDLDALEVAGLSRYQALSTATRAPGEFIRGSIPSAEPFGTVTPGSRADLVLTVANPLNDLATLRKPLGVMAKGKWYAASDLQALLDQLAETYERPFADQR